MPSLCSWEGGTGPVPWGVRGRAFVHCAGRPRSPIYLGDTDRRPGWLEVPRLVCKCASAAGPSITRAWNVLNTNPGGDGGYADTGANQQGGQHIDHRYSYTSFLCVASCAPDRFSEACPAASNCFLSNGSSKTTHRDSRVCVLYSYTFPLASVALCHTPSSGGGGGALACQDRSGSARSCM